MHEYHQIVQGIRYLLKILPCAFWFITFLFKRLTFPDSQAKRDLIFILKTLGIRVSSLLAERLNTYDRRKLAYSVTLRIQSGCAKIWTRITPNTDTFYAVLSSLYLKVCNFVNFLNAIYHTLLTSEIRNLYNSCKESFDKFKTIS